MKKEFKKINPAEFFISGIQEPETQPEFPKENNPVSVVPVKAEPVQDTMKDILAENRTKRTVLLLQPGLYALARKKAQNKKISMNEYVIQLLSEDLQ